ncbi:MAG: sugar O-acetyltransferase [Chloroflexota bacterium]|nr:MAG: sugar O-acetyltransferase [Chloroflexota bacterium]
MKSEKEKMLAGELYSALDAELSSARRQARNLIKELNDSHDDEQERRTNIISQLFGSAGKGIWIEPPFYCDYGSNITLGDYVFFNFNCVILDPAPVAIGNNVLFGPNVQIYTATHPISYLERRSGLESANAIEIGSDVWIGGSAVISPGVTIGSQSVIGAGSVVTKDIPAGVFAAGNPCRVIREIE